MNIIETSLNWNGSFNLCNVPKYIVLHHAEASSCTIEDIQAWHLANGWIGCGYQYFVRKDGSIYRGRPENAEGAHCPGMNIQSIGICAEGDYTKDVMPEVQKLAIIALCQNICSRYSIVEINGHKEWYSTTCPGPNYPLAEIINNKIQEVSDMKKIVVYLGDADVFPAIPVSQAMGCPVMKKSDFDASGLKADEIIQIGGKPGSTRVTTFKDAAALV